MSKDTKTPYFLKVWQGKSSGNKVEIHLHDTYEIYICQSHSLDYYIEGILYQLNIGDLVLTNMNELHRPIYLPHIPYERKFIQFSPNSLNILMEDNFDPLNYFNLPIPRRQHILRKSELETHGLTPLIDQLFNTSALSTPAGKLLQRTYLLQLLLNIYMITTSSDVTLDSIEPTYVDDRIQEVIHFLNQNYHDNFSLDDLAHRFHMDKYYLCHLFKSHIGITINKYIQSKRIQRAKRLLSAGHPVTETAYKVGYNDYSNFYKSFCKLVLMSPTDYLKNSH